MSLLLEDRDLLAAFRRGDRQALERVYEHYVDHVAAFLRGGFSFASKGETFTFKGCRQPSDLQDLLQETFCRALSPEARLAYDGIHPFRAYLLTIARNLTIDRFRRQVYEVFEPVGGYEPREEPADDGLPGRSPEAKLISKEVAALVRAFHQELGESEQAVLRVYFDGEEGQRQAAAALGMTRHQLRQTIGRIRRRLQRKLVQGGYLATTHAEQRRTTMLLLAALALR